MLINLINVFMFSSIEIAILAMAITAAAAAAAVSAALEAHPLRGLAEDG